MTEVYILKDIEEKDIIDAIIIRDVSGLDLKGKERIQTIINTVKNSRDDWNIEDIRDALPDDCEMITRWDTRWGEEEWRTVYY